VSVFVRDELHLHLYGCLTAADVWDLGKDRWQAQPERLAWYADEYFKQYGRAPDPAAYWRDAQGAERLAADFLFTEPAPFAKFQARFNLLIALFPIVPDDTTVLRRVLTRHRAEGRRYMEYRTLVPPAFDPGQIGRLLETAATAVREIERESGSAFTPRLALSLSRVNQTFLKQYQVLRDFLAARPDLAPAIPAIDLCGVEEGHAPAEKRAIAGILRRDNAAAPERALALLYHVGESYTDKPVVSAARWVHEAHALGAHRLGHAIALGVDPQRYAPVSGETRLIAEASGERRAHLVWLSANAGWLADAGYRVDHAAVRAELEKIATAPDRAPHPYAYDERAIDDTRRFQDALLADLARQGAVVESCPTSNRLIGEITDLTHHPLPRFVEAGLPVTLASDDPGIFACDLASEAALCRKEFGFGDAVFSAFAQTTEAARAGRLAGRPDD
jgi:hypothetical protein